MTLVIDDPVSRQSSEEVILRWIGRLAMLREEVETQEDRETVDEKMAYWREVIRDKRRESRT